MVTTGEALPRWGQVLDPASPPRLCVRWREGDRFDIEVRGHLLTVDQPGGPGADAGPTPTELFVASLASCIAFYAQRYLKRHGLDSTGLEVSTHFTMAERPSRVSSVGLEIRVPVELTPSRQRGLLAQARHCTVQNTLDQAPEVTISLK